MRNRAWGGIEYGMSGSPDVRDSLRLFASRFPLVAAESAKDELIIEVEEVRRATPFDTDPRPGQRGGDLRESVRLVGPEISNGEIVAAIAAGGEEFGVKHAIVQHERNYEHAEGQAKYIEDTLDASKGHMTARIVRNIQGRLEVGRG